ncbi:hypothetical protein ACWDA3_38680 [Nonomuraea rubra]
MHGWHRGDGLFDAGRGLAGLAQLGVVFGQRVRGGGQRDAAMLAACDLDTAIGRRERLLLGPSYRSCPSRTGKASPT